jgi:hypothetical protein
MHDRFVPRRIARGAALASRAISVAILCLLAGFAACGRSAAGEDPERQPPEPPRFEKPAMVAFHMRQHFADLREVERLLIAGKVEDARSRGFLLTKSAPDPGMARWQRDFEDVRDAASSLVVASGIDEALRREVRVAAACAACHIDAQKLPVFAEPTSVAIDDGTQRARMARHQWAADRLWEGLVGAADRPWRMGLDVLATTTLPYSAFTDAPLLAHQLQAFAQHAIASQSTDTLEDRTRMYGEMLVTCAACHSSLHVPR